MAYQLWAGPFDGMTMPAWNGDEPPLLIHVACCPYHASETETYARAFRKTNGEIVYRYKRTD